MKNTIFKKALTLALIILGIYSIPALAKEYKSGYVVLNNGDTLRGFIDYRYWDRNPTKITFSVAGNDEGITYVIEDLKGFEITGYDVYERGSFVAVDSTRNVWLKVLLKGDRLSLYGWNADETGFVIKETDSAYQHIIAHNRYRGYKRALYSIAVKYGLKEQLESRIVRAGYFEDDLVEIVKAINQQNALPPVDAKGYRVNKKLSFLLGGGIGMSKLIFNEDAPYLGSIKFKNSALPYIQAGLELSGSRSVRDFSLRLEAGYSQVSYSGDSESAGSFSASEGNGYDIDQKNVFFSVNVLYYFINTQKLKWFAGGGLGGNFTSHTKNDYRIAVPEMTIPDYLKLDSNWLQYNLRAGLRFAHHFEAVFQFAHSSNYYVSTSTALNSQTLMLGLNYIF